MFIETKDATRVAVDVWGTGGTVVAHAVGGLGTSRMSKLVLSAPITPCLTIGPDNALGLPAEAHAANRAAMAADIGGWIDANSAGYWGAGEDRWPVHRPRPTRKLGGPTPRSWPRRRPEGELAAMPPSSPYPILR